MELKNIKIPEETWWKISELKVKWRLKKMADVIEKLIGEKNE